MALPPHALVVRERRRRLRAMEVDRRRRYVEGAVEEQGHAEGYARHHRRLRLGDQRPERLCHRRGEGWRGLPLPRRRRYVYEGIRQFRPQATPLLLPPP